MRVSYSAKVILFDFDGVIIRPGEHNRLEWTHFGKTHGFEEPETIHDRVLGLSTEDGLKLLSSLPHGKTFDMKEALLEYDRHSLSNNDGILLTDGADDLLRDLPPERWAIVTTSSRGVTLDRLKHFGLPIPRLLVSADDIPAGKGKPNPWPYRTAMDRLGVTSADAAIVEDSPTGITAARQAGGKLIVMESGLDPSKIDLQRGECVIPDFKSMRVLEASQGLLIDCEASSVLTVAIETPGV